MFRFEMRKYSETKYYFKVYMNLSPEIPLKGGKIIELFGEVQFCDVNFRYPSRPNQAVLQHFDLTLPPRRIVALCGVSGGGTSFICSFNYGKYKTWKN
ncbi:mitochondrial potassium channel ATP-binding subunit-like isoform X3 [Parasteatoda tepidariorum]|uniref:mitochondrial potassium channel ATP-binding subunit-like isoform X3 n=1 Tax=Parasteatoda tepidariorum TaxID=114398 RepID=UPI0039BD21BF